MIDDKQNRIGPDYGKIANEQKKRESHSQLSGKILKFRMESDPYQHFCRENKVIFIGFSAGHEEKRNVKFSLSVDGDITKKNLSKNQKRDVKKS